MIKLRTLGTGLLLAAIAVSGTLAAQGGAQSDAVKGIAPSAITAHLEAASWTCSRKKTCGKISSCEEATWYLYNCSWGGKLDGDNGGKPCETLCGQDKRR